MSTVALTETDQTKFVPLFGINKKRQKGVGLQKGEITTLDQIPTGSTFKVIFQFLDSGNKEAEKQYYHKTPTGGVLALEKRENNLGDVQYVYAEDVLVIITNYQTQVVVVETIT